jgi:hypothetical protein
MERTPALIVLAIDDTFPYLPSGRARLEPTFAFPNRSRDGLTQPPAFSNVTSSSL